MTTEMSLIGGISFFRHEVNKVSIRIAIRIELNH